MIEDIINEIPVPIRYGRLGESYQYKNIVEDVANPYIRAKYSIYKLALDRNDFRECGLHTKLDFIVKLYHKYLISEGVQCKLQEGEHTLIGDAYNIDIGEKKSGDLSLNGARITIDTSKHQTTFDIWGDSENYQMIKEKTIGFFKLLQKAKENYSEK